MDCVLLSSGRVVKSGVPYTLLKDEMPVKAVYCNENTVGLGDIVKNITSFFGIEQKKGCGCKKRQQKLNKVRLPKLF